MKNPERSRYPALIQADLRALYDAEPTPTVRRLIWEIYCLHIVIKTARVVDMTRRDLPQNFQYALGELHEVLKAERYVHENLPSMHRFHEARKDRKRPKKAGSRR
ncbi:hypothetical protein [Ralstonia mannitolilytica]|nr:hypothetical protein [Ralstonia mannitolilytica]MBY4717470.1 hypothetical protein [Ralstonia mannitolilytica]